MRISLLLITLLLTFVAGCSAEPELTATPSFTPVPTWTSTPIVQVQRDAQATAEPSHREQNETSSPTVPERSVGLHPTVKVAEWTQEFYDDELRAGFLDERGAKAVATSFFPHYMTILQGPCIGDVDNLGYTFRSYFNDLNAIHGYGELASSLEYPPDYLPYIVMMIYVAFTIEQETGLSTRDSSWNVPEDSFDCNQILKNMTLAKLEAMGHEMSDRLKALDTNHE